MHINHKSEFKIQYEMIITPLGYSEIGIFILAFVFSVIN